MAKIATVLISLAVVGLTLTSASVLQSKFTNSKLEIGPTASLSGREVLDKDGKFAVSWNINENEKTIYFNVTAETLGYVGFGLSPNGGMQGADLFIAGVDANGKSYSYDYYGVGNTMPELDTEQNWELDSASENKTHTTVAFHRLLNTCDDKDFLITDATTRVIWSLGEDDNVQHHASRGVKSVNFYLGNEEDFDSTNLEKLDITKEFLMPAEHTTYWCSIHELPAFTEKHHVVAFEPILNSPEALEHTHHFIFHRCIAPPGEDPEKLFKPWTTHEGELCYGHQGNESFPFNQYCSGNMVYTWSKGGKRMVFPENVGYPIPENLEQREYYALEVHYDNPKKIAKTFKTGGRIFHTKNTRPIEAGLMVIQQDTSIMLTVPPQAEEFVVSGHCSPTCTESMLPEEGITVFNSMLHAHLTGRKIKLRHFRGSEELEWVDKDDYYDFDFQQNKNLNKVRKIERRDQLTVECTYNTMKVENKEAVMGGLSSHEEMCQAWIFYYPRRNTNACGSSQNQTLHYELLGIQEVKYGESNFPGGFESVTIVKPDNLAGEYIQSLSHKLNWTEEFRAKYQQEKRFGRQLASCQGLKKKTQIPLVVQYPSDLKEYVPVDECTKKDDNSSAQTFTVGKLAVFVALLGWFLR